MEVMALTSDVDARLYGSMFILVNNCVRSKLICSGLDDSAGPNENVEIYPVDSQILPYAQFGTMTLNAVLHGSTLPMDILLFGYFAIITLDHMLRGYKAGGSR